MRAKDAVLPETTLELASRLSRKWRRFWTGLYDANRLRFAIVTVLIVVIVGVILGILTDALMRRLGIDLNSREAGEE